MNLIEEENNKVPMSRGLNLNPNLSPVIGNEKNLMKPRYSDARFTSQDPRGSAGSFRKGGDD